LMRERGTARAGEEFLTARQRLGEIVMLGLRLREGFHLDEVSHRLSIDARRVLNGQLQDLTKSGVVCETQGLIQLAPQSIPVADAVAARLMP
jgi:coproporphyrinogen III oxidase-like Fe-S oxidoreductase